MKMCAMYLVNGGGQQRQAECSEEGTVGRRPEGRLGSTPVTPLKQTALVFTVWNQNPFGAFFLVEKT